MPSFDSASVPDSTDWLPTPLAALAPLEAALRCQVCKDFFNTPMMTSCSHTFCSLCIRRYLSQEGRCPACRSADQELKLRRNWVVDELVSGFVEGRESLISFAMRSTESERQRQGENATSRPKKRRKVHGPKMEEHGDLAERRSTRSQSRKDALQASQGSAEEYIIADSGDDAAGSEYEEQNTQIPLSTTIPAQVQAEPNDGLVACPVCGKRMKEEVVFTHLDHCTSSGGAQDDTAPTTNGPDQTQPTQPRPSIAYTPPNSTSTSKTHDRLPTLAYSMLSDTALRKKLQALGISSQGPKQLLQKRHTEWVNLWNANYDSRKPKTKRELLGELDIWERTQGRQILSGMNAAPGAGHGTGVMAKDFDGDAWMKGNKPDFEELVRKARETKAKAPLRGGEVKRVDSEARPATSAQENFQNAKASMDAHSASVEPTVHVVSEPQASNLRSPFFEPSVGNTSEPDRRGEIQSGRSMPIIDANGSVG